MLTRRTVQEVKRVPTILVLPFAQSIAKPGARALLLNPDNTRDRWVSLVEAAKAERPFAVEVAEDVLAVDSDRQELEERVRGLAEHLRLDGLRPVLVASGQAGHLHLFCRIRDASLLARYKERARALRLDVRSAIRPPLVVHRLGLPVALLDPEDPAEALAALTPPTNPPLSPRMADLLRSGDREDRYGKTGKRSSVIMAIVTGMVSAGWPLDEGFHALRDRSNRGGEKVQERAEGSAWQYVAACWAKAEAMVANHPTIRDRAAALHVIAEVRAAVEAHLWKGTSGATDRRVIEAHLRIATQTGKLAYGAAVRTVADLAGCGLEAVVKSHARLRHQGWLKLETGARPSAGRPNIWSLRIPTRGGTKPNSHISSLSLQGATNPNSQISPKGGDERDCTVFHPPAAGPHQDVWRRGALGGNAWLIWSKLDPERSRNSREIADVLRLDQYTVRRHLARLGKLGLAVRDKGWRWRRGEATPDEVAQKLGVAGKGERQRRRHDNERLAHRMRVDWERHHGVRV